MFTSYLDIFRHIVAYLKPCATLTYSESCHTLHPSIFRTQDIFRTLPRHIAAYTECYVTFVCWEPYHLQTFAIFRILGYLGPVAYSEFCLLGTFRHIQTYSIMIVIITLTFFFHFNLTYFSMKSKKMFLTTMTSISTLIYLNNMWSLKIAL